MIDRSQFPILSDLERSHGLIWTDSDRGECFCPGHDDGEKKGKRSLHVGFSQDSEGNPRLLLHCLAGCENGPILQALGKGFSALFPDRARVGGTSGKSGGPAADGNGVFECCYSYKNAAGQLVHQTVRFKNPKRFSQRRPAREGESVTVGKKPYQAKRDPKGQWWIWTLHDVETVIYNLPAIAAADPSKPIFLCEGEKDADRLIAAGLLATTVPMGSGKWRPHYAEFFRGRKVAIIPDMDRPRTGQVDPMANAGVDGSRVIAGKLVDVAADVRIVYLPNPFGLQPKWDLSDWLNAGGTGAMFGAACEAAESLTPGHPGLKKAGKRAAQLTLDSDAPTLQDDAGEPQATPDDIWAGSQPQTSQQAQQQPQKNPANGQPSGEVGPLEISNYLVGPDGPEALPMRQILANIHKAARGWPKRIGSALFYCDKESDPDAITHSIDWLVRSPALFGWLGNFTNVPIDFARVPRSHTKDETFAELQRTAEKFRAVSTTPHYPPIPGLFYACPDVDKWKSKRPGCLMRFIQFFSPATTEDFDLMLAMVLTPFWGGPGGSRPLFVITSDAGRGAGKTTFAELAMSLVGGSLSLSSNADDEIVRQRLLSPEGMEKTAVLLDNVKSMKFSCAELEALITSENISGKRMYVGEGSRPNLLTWIITINGPSFSTDLAQRAITIKLKKPLHTGEWQKQAMEFLKENHASIVAEILDILKTEIPEDQMLKAHTRWAAWENGVLSKLSNAKACQAIIVQRQNDLDVEQEEGHMIQDQFARQLSRNNFNPQRDRVFVPNDIAASWLNLALGEKHSKVSAVRIMSRMIGEGRLCSIKRNPHPQRLEGTTLRERGFWWEGPEWQGEESEGNRPSNLQSFQLEDDYLGGLF